MIDVDITLKNYRCFGDEPTTLRITDGFTALVGVNNSGKSSLLRVLYEIRPLLIMLSSTPHASNPSTQLVLGASPGGVWHPALLTGERVQRAGSDRPVEIELTVRDGTRGKFVTAEGEQLILNVKYDGNSSTELRTDKGKVIGSPSTQVEIASLEFAPFIAAMQELSQAIYIGPFRNAINVGAQQPYYDIQTGDAFVGAFASYKSGPDAKQNEAVYELLQELKRIFEFNALDMNAAPDGKSLQLTVDGRSYRLGEQGAGLAHFIVVLVNVLVRQPSFLLIDEPELNLHASLQLDFLQTLARYTKYGVIFATHSLGLARTAADRIYTLTKPPAGVSTVRPYEGDRELITLLGQLSFDRRPDLGFSKVLLVEGKTELRALMQFLRFYRKEHEVLMLPLHGHDMIRGDVEHELAELLRVGGEVRYLIDSERSAKDEPLEANRQAFVDLCTKLGIKGHVLEQRALENYFTDAAVKRAFGDSASAPGPYDKKGPGQNWPKANNWRVATEMDKSDLDGTDLGQFLGSL